MEDVDQWAQQSLQALNVARVYCSVVCIFHRRGLTELCLRTLKLAGAKNLEVPKLGRVKTTETKMSSGVKHGKTM